MEEVGYNGASIVPTLDSIQEFRLLTNSFDAEFGHFSGSANCSSRPDKRDRAADRSAPTLSITSMARPSTVRVLIRSLRGDA